MGSSKPKRKTQSEKIDEEEALSKKKTRFFIVTVICEGLRVATLIIVWRILHFLATFGTVNNPYSAFFDTVDIISTGFGIVLWALLIYFQLKKHWSLMK